MFPTGILARISLEDLIESLSEHLVSSSPPGTRVSIGGHDSSAGRTYSLELVQWSDNWCLLETDASDEELAALLVKSLSRLKPSSEVLACRFFPTAGDYSYSYFRDGVLLESFECQGFSMEALNFTSELRKVPIQSLLRVSDFISESLGYFGISPGPDPEKVTEKIKLQVTFPEKRTFWQVILGAVTQK